MLLVGGQVGYGSSVGNATVIHTFANGMVLTYEYFEKRYGANIGQPYFINYNVYKVLDVKSGKSYVVNVVQSERVEPATIKVQKLNEKFLNKDLYAFDNLIFSELVDDVYVLTAAVTAMPGKRNAGINLENLASKKIWGVADVLASCPFNGQRDITVARPGTTLSDAAESLFGVLEINLDMTKSYGNVVVKSNEPDIYNVRIRKSRWNSLVNRLLDLN